MKVLKTYHTLQLQLPGKVEVNKKIQELNEFLNGFTNMNERGCSASRVLNERGCLCLQGS